MKHILFILSFVIVTLLSFMPARSQQFTRKESSVTMGGPSHDIIRCPNGDQLVITYPLLLDKEPLPIAITRFDPQLSIRYNNPLKELPGFHYRGAVYSAGRLFLLCNDKDGAVSRYEVDEKTGQLIGKPLSLFSLAEKEEDGTFFTGNASNKNFHYCFWKNAGKKSPSVTLQGVIFDKEMNITGRFSYTTPEEKKDYNNLDVVQSDKGLLTIIYSAAAKTKKEEYMPFKYTLVQVDEKGHTSATLLTGLPVGKIDQLSWTMQQDDLIFTGLSAPAKRKDLTMVVGGRFDQASKKITDVRQTEISALLSNSPAFLKIASGRGLGSVTLSRSLSLVDGSRILILEDAMEYRHEGYVGGVISPGHVTFGGPVVNIWQNNVYVVKVDPNNTPVWFNIVSKYQLEQDLDLRLGISSTLDEKNNLQLFFYDRDKHTDPSDPGIGYVDYVSIGNKMKENVKLACVTIAPDGKMKKQFVENTADYEFQLMPQYSLFGEGNAIYFMAVKAIRARTPIYYLTHSDYRFGILTINY